MGTIHRWTAVGLGLLLVACEPGPTAPAPELLPPLDATARFNPQPEPPPGIFEFELTGEIDGRWDGMFGARGGEVMVEPLAFEMNGQTLHLSQEWTFVPPEPVVPPDPIVPPEPIMLRGTVNLSTGRLVLNGATEDGVPVHVQGQVMPNGGGVFNIGGEVMFNPQPEPPPSG